MNHHYRIFRVSLLALAATAMFGVGQAAWAGDDLSDWKLPPVPVPFVIATVIEPVNPVAVLPCASRAVT